MVLKIFFQAILASRENLLDNLVLSRDKNNGGVYLIRLHQYGKILDILVDDIFPCDGYRRLMFARVGILHYFCMLIRVLILGET
jgi:hypothetical protein